MLGLKVSHSCKRDPGSWKNRQNNVQGIQVLYHWAHWKLIHTRDLLSYRVFRIQTLVKMHVDEHMIGFILLNVNETRTGPLYCNVYQITLHGNKVKIHHTTPLIHCESITRLHKKCTHGSRFLLFSCYLMLAISHFFHIIQDNFTGNGTIRQLTRC